MRQNANKMPIADQGRKNVQELDSVGVVDKMPACVQLRGTLHDTAHHQTQFLWAEPYIYPISLLLNNNKNEK